LATDGFSPEGTAVPETRDSKPFLSRELAHQSEADFLMTGSDGMVCQFANQLTN
jgi:hypothetical protein